MPRSPVSGQVRLNGRLGVGDNPSTWMPRAAFISADPPKVVPLAQQPSFVRVARNSLRVGRTLPQTWWGEAVLAKVRLHVPVDYFRIVDQPGLIHICFQIPSRLFSAAGDAEEPGRRIRTPVEGVGTRLIGPR